MKNILTAIIGLMLLFIPCNMCSLRNNMSAEPTPKAKTGTAEIRVDSKTYEYVKSIGDDILSSDIDGDDCSLEMKDNYVVLCRKGGYSAGLHNIKYGINTSDSTYMKTLHNFPIYAGDTTVYYDKDILVDVVFDVTIDPSFDREYIVDLTVK